MTLVGDPGSSSSTSRRPASIRAAAATMWQIIRDLVADGVTIFLTTQYLEEADQLADRIAVLDHGRLVAEGTPAELKRLVPGGHIRLGSPTDGLDSAATCSMARPATRRRSRFRSRATATSGRCGRSSTGSTPPPSRLTGLSFQTPDLEMSSCP